MSTFAYTPTPSAIPSLAQLDAKETRRLVLLAPMSDLLPSDFGNVRVDPGEHGDLLGQMQRLRGAVYLEDGAIQESDLDSKGRHIMPSDSKSLHVLVLNGAGRVLGCVRFLPQPVAVDFEDLSLSRSPLAHDPIRGRLLRQAVNEQITSARKRGYRYVEVSGWALDQSIRHTTEAVRIALLNFSLGLALGGAVGICTATVRNHSSAILRRIGGRTLAYGDTTISPYFDARYGCEIEIMTFDSDWIEGRYAARIEQLRSDLHGTNVICNQLFTPDSLRALAFATALRGIHEPASVAA